MLSSWIKKKKLVGRPKLTYGATIKKALNHFNLTEKQTGLPWHTLACNRELWKLLICLDNYYK